LLAALKLQRHQSNLSGQQANGTSFSIVSGGNKKDWIYKGQHGFRHEFSRESQVIIALQDIADSLNIGGTIEAVIIDLSKAFD
jgi:hypothetical protein